MERRTSEKLGTWLLVWTLLWIFPDTSKLAKGVLTQLQLPQTNVEVIQHQTVILKALYSGDITQATIVWNYMAGDSKVVISYINGNIQTDEKFKNRVGFINQMPNNEVSISINNTVESDSGLYMVQVVAPTAPGSPKQLTLSVLVPPAMPVCALQGKPVLKANITLTCNSNTGKPMPKYKWSKTSPSSEIFFAPALNATAGTLKLNNLSSNMSGKYECSASNSAGESKCYINLEVITSTNAGVIAGATVGAVVGLILIILVLIFLWTRRRESEEELANDIKEDAQAPKRVSWAKSGTGSDMIFKNGTLSSTNSSPQPRDTYISHQQHQNHGYPHTHAPSDTASIITATGSVSAYRPRPTPSSATPERTLPGGPPGPPGPLTSNGAGGSLPRTEGVVPVQTSHPPPIPTGISAANISRMGGVPIMVPAQNQAGSLV